MAAVDAAIKVRTDLGQEGPGGQDPGGRADRAALDPLLIHTSVLSWIVLLCPTNNPKLLVKGVGIPQNRVFMHNNCFAEPDQWNAEGPC